MNLPNEVIEEVLSHLTDKQQYRTATMLNRQWHRVCEGRKRELIDRTVSRMDLYRMFMKEGEAALDATYLNGFVKGKTFEWVEEYQSQSMGIDWGMVDWECMSIEEFMKVKDYGECYIEGCWNLFVESKTLQEVIKMIEDDNTPYPIDKYCPAFTLRSLADLEEYRKYFKDGVENWCLFTRRCRVSDIICNPHLPWHRDCLTTRICWVHAR